ncbi:hypothetical protein Nepgr_020353 [Nepenthes gracilis]|uniref:Uncharacterized protein n=1 Tax=Nepenthes gracilis TaxID=150966 RepID=A0AAD3SXZ4_NEPGR|nr:hypothetical protein Nepgr_020353 [Nepenthes gracilis]
MGVEDLLDRENQVTDCDLDDDSSQCSEDWNVEAIANDPMYYALRALIGNNDSRAYFKSIGLDQRGAAAHSPLTQQQKSPQTEYQQHSQLDRNLEPVSPKVICGLADMLLILSSGNQLPGEVKCGSYSLCCAVKYGVEPCCWIPPAGKYRVTTSDVGAVVKSASASLVWKACWNCWKNILRDPRYTGSYFSEDRGQLGDGLHWISADHIRITAGKSPPAK